MLFMKEVGADCLDKIRKSPEQIKTAKNCWQ